VGRQDRVDRQFVRARGSRGERQESYTEKRHKELDVSYDTPLFAAHALPNLDIPYPA